MRNNTNEFVLFNILNNIPSHIKPVPYLMDILDLSKKSAYRRINGEIPFTMEEISKLSLLLNFSVDKIVGQIKDNLGFFHLEASMNGEATDSFIFAINTYCEMMEKLHNTDNSEIIIAMNRLPNSMLLRYPALLKFKYFQWVHRMNNLPFNFCYKDITLPSGLLSKYSQIEQHEDNLTNNHLIIDNNFFFNIIKDIEYFHKRNLVTSELLDLMKNDILNLLAFFEKTARDKVNHKGSTYNWYISSFEIDSNSSFCRVNDYMISSFFIHSVNSISITDTETCLMHKKWLLSLKKYSTLVSGSNESQLAEFCDKQRILIDII